MRSILVSERSFILGQNSYVRMEVLSVSKKDAQVIFLIFVAKLKRREIRSPLVTESALGIGPGLGVGPFPNCRFAKVVRSSIAADRAAANQDCGESIVRLSIKDRVERQ